MITISYKYKITTTLIRKNSKGNYDFSDKPACEFEVETDTLDDKPSLEDLISVAKAFNCPNELLVYTVIEDVVGDYVDSEEFEILIDYDKKTAIVID